MAAPAEWSYIIIFCKRETLHFILVIYIGILFIRVFPEHSSIFSQTIMPEIVCIDYNSPGRVEQINFLYLDRSIRFYIKHDEAAPIPWTVLCIRTQKRNND